MTPDQWVNLLSGIAFWSLIAWIPATIIGGFADWALHNDDDQPMMLLGAIAPMIVLTEAVVALLVITW